MPSFSHSAKPAIRGQAADFLKSDIAPYEDSLAHVLQINPLRYRFKEELGLGTDKHVEVAARDQKQIAPYMAGAGRLKPDSDEQYLTVDNRAITYMLINAVEELNAEIEALKADLKILKGK